MHDWTYESLIRKLKATLVEIDREPDPSPAERSREDASGPPTSSAWPHAGMNRHPKQTRKGNG